MTTQHDTGAESPNLWTLVPAAGVGARMRSDRPKQYLQLLGQPVIELSLQRLLAHPRIAQIQLILDRQDPYWDALPMAGDPRIERVAGGSERCYSVRNALQQIADRARPDDWVLVHDVARPCLRHRDLEALLNQLWNDDVGGLLGVPVADTLKRTDASGQVLATIDRRHAWRAYTPQMFRYGLLRQCLQRALEAGVQVTDEASALEAEGYKPRMVEGHSDNIKITVPEDLALAELYLKQIQRLEGDLPFTEMSVQSEEKP